MFTTLHNFRNYCEKILTDFDESLRMGKPEKKNGTDEEEEDLSTREDLFFTFISALHRGGWKTYHISNSFKCEFAK